MSEKSWNIWSVKNRWLRAGVAWLLAPPGIMLAYTIFTVAALWEAIKWGVDTFREDMRDFTRDVPWEIMWRAMTAKEAK